MLDTDSVYLVESLPTLLGRVDRRSSLDGPLEPRGPHAEVGNVLGADELSQ